MIVTFCDFNERGSELVLSPLGEFFQPVDGILQKLGHL